MSLAQGMNPPRLSGQFHCTIRDRTRVGLRRKARESRGPLTDHPSPPLLRAPIGISHHTITPINIMDIMDIIEIMDTMDCTRLLREGKRLVVKAVEGGVITTMTIIMSSNAVLLSWGGKDM